MAANYSNIIRPDADIAELILINIAKQTRNTVDERFWPINYNLPQLRAQQGAHRHRNQFPDNNQNVGQIEWWEKLLVKDEGWQNLIQPLFIDCRSGWLYDGRKNGAWRHTFETGSM